jgi:hypothetical protein
MKIKPEQLERLAGSIVSTYRKNELIHSTANDQALKAKIIEVIGKNFAEEDAIEEEARKMLSAHGQETRNMDPFKMFLLAKQKLAAKKGFIL